MKLRVGKELLTMMQTASSRFGLSFGEIAAKTLRRHERQPVDVSAVDDPGGGAGGTVITVDAPEGMEQATLRKLLWVRLTDELAKPQKKSRFESNLKPGKDYKVVELI